MKRARVVTLNAALGPLDYRVPEDMAVEPGSIVVAPLGPRQLLGVAWEADRLPTNEVPDTRLRPLAGVVDVPPIAAALRRLCEWTGEFSRDVGRMGDTGLAGCFRDGAALVFQFSVVDVLPRLKY